MEGKTIYYTLTRDTEYVDKALTYMECFVKLDKYEII